MEKILIALISMLLMVACSDEKNKVEDHILKDHMDMINKAKEVEKMMQDAATLQEQRINEQMH